MVGHTGVVSPSVGVVSPAAAVGKVLGVVSASEFVSDLVDQRPAVELVHEPVLLVGVVSPADFVGQLVHQLWLAPAAELVHER